MITVQKLSKNKVQTLFCWIIKMIHLPGGFVVRNTTYSPICVLRRFFSPNDSNACRIHNQGKICKETWIKVQLLFEYYNYLSARCFCYHWVYIWLYMYFGENLLFQMKKFQQKHNNCPKSVRKQDTKSVIGSTSKISHLPDVFIIGKATCGPTCVSWSFSPKWLKTL